MLFSLIFYKNENLVFRKRKSIDPSQDIWISYEELLLRGDCQIWFHKIKLFNFLLWLNPLCLTFGLFSLLWITFTYQFQWSIIMAFSLLTKIDALKEICAFCKFLYISGTGFYQWALFFLVFFGTHLEENVCLAFLWITL